MGHGSPNKITPADGGRRDLFAFPAQLMCPSKPRVRIILFSAFSAVDVTAKIRDGVLHRPGHGTVRDQEPEFATRLYGRGDFHNSEGPTRRSSEREPADSLRDKSKVVGGWLRSMTFALNIMGTRFPVRSGTADSDRWQQCTYGRLRPQTLSIPWLASHRCARELGQT